MQSDEQLDPTLVSTPAWELEPVTGRTPSDVNRFELPSLERGKLSFSGNERNHLFQNLNGSEYRDISGISGLESNQDGRTFAVWDFDRDGGQDILLLNINTPVLSLFRNQRVSAVPARKTGRMVAFRFVGGNRSPVPSKKFGPRDGYGVEVSVNLPNQSMIQQHQCGEGLAAQNSKFTFFGIGENDLVDSVNVRWPSGIVQQSENIPAGKLVTVYENATDSPDGSGFELTDYVVEMKQRVASTNEKTLSVQFPGSESPSSSLTVYTSVATWCPNCRKQIPQLNLLQESFSEEQLKIVATPVDTQDSADKFAAYISENHPPYGLPASWDNAQIQSFTEFVKSEAGVDVLPASVVVNEDGVVVFVKAGVPTVSEISRILDE